MIAYFYSSFFNKKKLKLLNILNMYAIYNKQLLMSIINQIICMYDDIDNRNLTLPTITPSDFMRNILDIVNRKTTILTNINNAIESKIIIQTLFILIAINLMNLYQ